MTIILVVVGVNVVSLLTPSSYSVASSIGGSKETPFTDSIVGGGPIVIGTRRAGRAGLPLYRGLSMSLINTAFVDYIMVV